MSGSWLLIWNAQKRFGMRRFSYARNSNDWTEWRPSVDVCIGQVHRLLRFEGGAEHVDCAVGVGTSRYGDQGELGRSRLHSDGFEWESGPWKKALPRRSDSRSCLPMERPAASSKEGASFLGDNRSFRLRKVPCALPSDEEMASLSANRIGPMAAK